MCTFLDHFLIIYSRVNLIFRKKKERRKLNVWVSMERNPTFVETERRRELETIRNFTGRLSFPFQVTSQTVTTKRASQTWFQPFTFYFNLLLLSVHSFFLPSIHPFNNSRHERRNKEDFYLCVINFQARLNLIFKPEHRASINRTSAPFLETIFSVELLNSLSMNVCLCDTFKAIIIISKPWLLLSLIPIYLSVNLEITFFGLPHILESLHCLELRTAFGKLKSCIL